MASASASATLANTARAAYGRHERERQRERLHHLNYRAFFAASAQLWSPLYLEFSTAAVATSQMDRVWQAAFMQVYAACLHAPFFGGDGWTDVCESNFVQPADSIEFRCPRWRVIRSPQACELVFVDSIACVSVLPYLSIPRTTMHVQQSGVKWFTGEMNIQLGLYAVYVCLTKPYKSDWMLWEVSYRLIVEVTDAPMDRRPRLINHALAKQLAFLITLPYAASTSEIRF